MDKSELVKAIHNKQFVSKEERFHFLNLGNVDLSDVHLAHANLSGANFTGANLSNSNLWGVNFIDTILNGANLSYTKPIAPGTPKSESGIFMAEQLAVAISDDATILPRWLSLEETAKKQVRYANTDYTEKGGAARHRLIENFKKDTQLAELVKKEFTYLFTAKEINLHLNRFLTDNGFTEKNYKW